MISVKELSKRYGHFLAVDNISLEIPEGQVMGLLGPNGAGKSTTLRVLTGYLRPTLGTIYVDGMDVREKAEEAKAIIGYLPESSPLYPDMLVFDYLEYIAGIRGLDGVDKMKRIRHLADLCGITQVMHKNISELSKGYRQRVGLALAMMSDPKILVLDEPTSGLDPNQIREIRSIIKEIGKEKTVIFSTHILSEAEATCDRAVIINQGQIVADGSMAELASGAGRDGSLKLSLKNAKADDAKKLLSKIPGVHDYQALEVGDLLNLTLLSKEDLREQAYSIIKSQDWVLMAMEQQRQSLEDIFKELTLGGESNEA